MALNPNTVKALFGKLVPYTDDAVKAVANYGDDVADDVTRLSKYVSKNNALSPVVSQPVKTALQAPTRNSYGFSNDAPEGVLAKMYSSLSGLPITPYKRYEASRTFNNAVDNAGWRGNTVPAKGFYSHLGNFEPHGFEVVGGSDGAGWYEPSGSAVTLPEIIPANGLVNSGKTVRPHKNTALGKWYANKVADFESLSSTAPDLDYDTSAFKNAKDQSTSIDFLDTEDMLKRVKDATYGNIPGISDSDAFSYVSKMPKLEYVDPNTVEYLHNALSKRYDTSKKLQNTFGRAPSSFASNDEYSNALASLFDELNKLPF